MAGSTFLDLPASSNQQALTYTLPQARSEQIVNSALINFVKMKEVKSTVSVTYRVQFIQAPLNRIYLQHVPTLH